ncbi:FAD/NAD(P)-binding protein [Corynebacterium sp.]|uniref:FAD/NAD(P)-binding protein n=1 Tax=Corynebacterium sp. TaxID=1720 RepID=UPI0025C4BED3|nr:FAD/NAD(P)-binding protein [Corynebacterium sp.]
MSSVVIVGAGPRATGLLLALASELRGRTVHTPVTVHVIDPFPAGAGRIWRAGQPGEVWMNNTSDEITVYPGGTGPTLAEWSGRPDTYLPRREVAGYLGEAFDRAVEAMPEGVTVTTRRTRAVELSGTSGARRVRLEDGGVVEAELVVLAQGHLDAVADGEEGGDGGTGSPGHIPAGCTVDMDYSGLRGGEDVLVRGFGLAFIDLMMLMSEGRGGRFERNPGELVPSYRPSGAEPVLWVGSRRGVPYRSKIAGGVPGRHCRYADVETLGRLPRGPGGQVFRDGSVRSLLTAEFSLAHYSALAELRDPSRCSLGVRQVQAITDSWVSEVGGAGSAAVDALHRAVPRVSDRWDLDRVDRPLAGRICGDRDRLEQAVADHVSTNLTRATDGRHPQDAALYGTLVAVLPVLQVLLSGGEGLPGLAPGDEAFVRRLCGAFSYVCSGPPPERLGNLLALHRAGLVRFLGPGARFSEVPDREGGGHAAESPAVGGPVPAVRTARLLVDARLAELSADRVSDPLTRGLLAAGELSTTPGSTGREVLLVDGDDRAVGRDGVAREDIVVLGPVTSSPVREGFARPGVLTRVFDANRRTAATLVDRLVHGAPHVPSLASASPVNR